MFKARKKNPKLKEKFRKQKREEDDDDDADDENDTGGQETSASSNNNNNDGAATTTTTTSSDNTADAIARIKKKRKLLTELQYKKGTNAAALLTARTALYGTTPGAEPDGTLAGAATDNTASSSQEGIMEQKHKQALEEYVEAKLAGIAGDSVQKNQRDMNGGEEASSTTTQNQQQPKLTKEELYKQLSQTSESMAGRSTGGSGGDNGNKSAADADGDVGAGGAMLVAGTGLAEVILPVNDRLKVVAAAQQAAAQQGPSRGKTYFGMPATSNHAVPAGTARFSVSAADKHRHFANNTNNSNHHHRGGPNQQPSDPQQQNSTSITALDDVEETEAEKSRMGFEARQGKVTGTATSSGANDNKQRYQNDSKHTRASDDKVYGKFIKKQRDNQRRGR